MRDKKEFLLQSIIKAYIEHLEPIGSTQLKALYDISYSSATIRGYFKKLGDEGYLLKEHISSGRTPSINALKEYWIKNIKLKLGSINLNNLESSAKEIGVSVFLKKEKNDILINILNVENKYMILEFTTFSCSLRFSNALYRFLKDMLGLEIKDVIRISKEVGANELHEAVTRFLRNTDYQIFNYKVFLKLALKYNFDEYLINRFLKGNILEDLDEKIYFDKLVPLQCMGISHNCKINNNNVKMLVIGELSKNYEYFYKKITIF